MPSTASAGVDMTATMGRVMHSSTPVRTTDRPMNRVTVLPMHREARLWSPPPTAWPMLTVAPMARPTSMTVSMCITWEPTDTAVVLSTPRNWPMMNRSAMP